MTIQVVGIGAGGHCKVVIEALSYREDIRITGLVDRNPLLWGTQQMGIPVLGSDEILPELFRSGVNTVFIGVGGTERDSRRRVLYEWARDNDFDVLSCIHPTAIVSNSARIARGATILAGAIVNTAVGIGQNVIINSGAIVEHDCTLDDHSHVAPGAILASTVHVCEGAHVGIGASVRQKLRVGRNAVIGAGAVVIRDVPDDTIVVGVPAHELRKRGHGTN